MYQMMILLYRILTKGKNSTRFISGFVTDKKPKENKKVVIKL